MRAGQPAAVLLLEFHRIGKPAHRVAERADRELDQDLAVRWRSNRGRSTLLALLPDLDAEAHEIALGAVDAAGLELGLEQDVAGVEIAQPHAPGLLALRHDDPAAVVEIEPDALGGLLRRHFGRRRIIALRRP